MVRHHKCLLKRLSVALSKVRVTLKVGHFNECLSIHYFLYAWSFTARLGIMLHQHEAECYSKEWFIISPMPRLLWGLVQLNYDSFCHICWTADPFATKFSLMVHHYHCYCLVKRLDFYVQGDGDNEASLNVCQSSIFCTADLFSTKLGVLMRYWCC